MAVARLGITVQDFYRMTPIEFAYAMEAKNKHEKRLVRGEYERLRISLLHQWNMAGKSLKKKMRDVKDVMKLPWDTEQAPKKQSQPEIKAAVERIAKIFGKKK